MPQVYSSNAQLRSDFKFPAKRRPYDLPEICCFFFFFHLVLSSYNPIERFAHRSAVPSTRVYISGWFFVSSPNFFRKKKKKIRILYNTGLFSCIIYAFLTRVRLIRFRCAAYIYILVEPVPRPRSPNCSEFYFSPTQSKRQFVIDRSRKCVLLTAPDRGGGGERRKNQRRTLSSLIDFGVFFFCYCFVFEHSSVAAVFSNRIRDNLQLLLVISFGIFPVRRRCREKPAGVFQIAFNERTV